MIPFESDEFTPTIWGILFFIFVITLLICVVRVLIFFLLKIIYCLRIMCFQAIIRFNIFLESIYTK